MSPELLTILGTPIWAYGFMLALALAVGLWMTVRYAAQDDLPAGKVCDMALAIIPAALLGAQLMKILDRGPSALRHPVGTGSGAYLGGFLIGVLVSFILTHFLHLPWRPVADAFAPSLALGYAITRVGCFLAGCCWGRPTDSWIGVKFTGRAHLLTGVPIDHRLVPTQLIETAAGILIFAALLWLRRRRAFPGQIIFAYVLCSSVERFVIEQWRDTPSFVWGLSSAQLIAAILFAICLAVYAALSLSPRGLSCLVAEGI